MRNSRKLSSRRWMIVTGKPEKPYFREPLKPDQKEAQRLADEVEKHKRQAEALDRAWRAGQP